MTRRRRATDRVTLAQKSGRRMVYSLLGQAAGKGAESLEGLLRRPQAAPLIILLLWAGAVLPNLTLRSFIWEEGTNAEIARDVVAHRHFLVPIVYGIPWSEKPSLLAWLIAGVAAVTGQVNEWSARLPAMISVLLTALMVQGLTRRYASLPAALFAALCFLFSPLLLQKLTIAEPDTVITLLSFAAFIVWWNGIAAGGVSIWRWIVCGLLLAVLAMAKGPQPAGFFALGTLAYLIVEHRWSDLPGWFLCMILPLATTIAWGAAVYQPGVETTWLSYARLTMPATLGGYVASNSYGAVSLVLQLLPATLVLPFVVLARRQDPTGLAGALLLYSSVCLAALVLWPGFNPRYAMPIAPALAVLAGMGWDLLAKTNHPAVRWAAAALLCAFIVYRLVLVAVIMPVFSDHFGASRNAGAMLERAIGADPAPAYCFGLSTNQLFYVRKPLQCLDGAGQQSVKPPAWLLIPHSDVAPFARLRPDLDVRLVVETGSGPQLAAVRIDKKSGEK
jgi:4-amino-4-deoxy-L-arabinose transferase-like glycosyltransferase